MNKISDDFTGNHSFNVSDPSLYMNYLQYVEDGTCKVEEFEEQEEEEYEGIKTRIMARIYKVKELRNNFKE